MLLPQCPNCGCTATGPSLHGTSLVLCSFCWTVVDPTVPPLPLVAASHPTWTLADVGEPDSDSESADPLQRPKLDFASLPPCPRPSPSPSTLSWNWLVLVALVLLAVPLGFGLWLVQAYYPRFEDATAPNGDFVLAFPGTPYWQPPLSMPESDEIGPGAYLSRRYRGHREEVYSLQVLRLSASSNAAARNPAMVALEKATKLAGPMYSSQSTRPHIVTLPGYACAEFERINWLSTPTTTTAGRVILDGGHYYILTVTGPDVALSDWRVQRFFNSFRRIDLSSVGSGLNLA